MPSARKAATSTRGMKESAASSDDVSVDPCPSLAHNPVAVLVEAHNTFFDCHVFGRKSCIKKIERTPAVWLHGSAVMQFSRSGQTGHR